MSEVIINKNTVQKFVINNIYATYLQEKSHNIKYNVKLNLF